MRTVGWLLSVVLLATIFGDVRAAHAASCADLKSRTLPSTTITLAETVAPGAFAPPRAGNPQSPAPPAAPAFRELPEFCRVAATLKPSADSDITIEVWLPASGWNGKFTGVGNGGWGGTISYGAMASALRRGYATASTDTGHKGGAGDGSFAFKHPEKVVDFAYRAVHEMTVQAKTLINAYYGTGPRLSYWNGCSTGGRQGLKEAQRFPADYDGIVAGAPANYMTRLGAHGIWVAQATLEDPASFIPREKYATLNAAVMTACDRLDGVGDGVIENPPACRFDPAVLLCPGADTAACLTPAQVEAARKIYGPARNPRTGAEVFPGLEPGSERGWGALAGGPAPMSIPNDHFRYIVFENPDWDFKSLDFDKDVARADAQDNGLLNTIDPNLTPFFGRGGKLLMYHGWNDQLIAPQNSINYYTSVVNAVGRDAASASMRLFMVPGLNHCGGGDGPTTFDAMAALEAWVERKEAPQTMIGSRLSNGVTTRTRPLCPYPQVAVYTGTGSTDTAANFACKAP